jgi:sugar phosphate permease
MLVRYIIAGAITIGWSIILVLLLPDTPAQAPRWLFSEEEVCMLQARQNIHLGGPNHVEWNQVKEALLDPKVWVMAAMGAAIYVCNGGKSDFMPSIAAH